MSTPARGSRRTSRSTDGRITYVGPREPSGDVIDVTGKVLVPGYIEPHTHPWCLYSPASLLEVAVPDGTTTLVYDNLFFYLSHGVDGLRQIVDAMNDAPAHVRWVARLAPQTAYADDGSRSTSSHGCSPGPRWWRAARSRTGARRRAGSSRRASRRRRRRGGGSRATTRARPTTGSRSSRWPGSPPITRRSRARKRSTACGSACGRCCATRRCGRTWSACCEELAPVIGSSRRLMLTTDGAVPSFYAEHGVIGGALRIATANGVDPMRALQMATIDPATFLLLDEELGGIAPGRRATLNVLPEIGEWRPGARLRRRARGRARRAADRSDAGDRLARRPEARRAAARRVRAAHRDPARRALRERRDQPAPRQSRARDAGRAGRPRRLVDHEGRRREPPARRGRASRPLRRPRSSCSCSAPTRTRWPAPPRRWPRWAAGSRSTAAGARRSRSTG